MSERLLKAYGSESLNSLPSSTFQSLFSIFIFPQTLSSFSKTLAENSSTPDSSTTHLPFSSYLHRSNFIFIFKAQYHKSLFFLVIILASLCLFPFSFSPSYISLFHLIAFSIIYLLLPNLLAPVTSLSLHVLLHPHPSTSLSVAWPFRVSIRPAHSSHYHSTSNTPWHFLTHQRAESRGCALSPSIAPFLNLILHSCLFFHLPFLTCQSFWTNTKASSQTFLLLYLPLFC